MDRTTLDGQRYVLQQSQRGPLTVRNMIASKVNGFMIACRFIQMLFACLTDKKV
jgi:hypothetical protein